MKPAGDDVGVAILATKSLWYNDILPEAQKKWQGQVMRDKASQAEETAGA
jgi:hypothetical protein